jgi:hypothetical protein
MAKATPISNINSLENRETMLPAEAPSTLRMPISFVPYTACGGVGHTLRAVQAIGVGDGAICIAHANVFEMDQQTATSHDWFLTNMIGYEKYKKFVLAELKKFNSENVL